MNCKAQLIGKILCGTVLALLLAACVTTDNKRFGDNADEGKALQQYTELGLRYIQQGKTVEARRPLKRALEINDKSPDVHHALAILFQKEQEPALADEHFLKALRYGPERTSYRNNYAAFLFGQKRYAEACQQFEKAGEDTLYDNRSAVYENLGVCYLELGRKEEALTSFERAISINDAQPRALLEASLLHFEKGNLKTSAKYHAQYQQLVRFRFTSNTPRNLALGVKLARSSGDKNQEASYMLMLKNMFPDSDEYRDIQK
ncbi:MAG: type IV pilus biogenesis/stability protein PilW [Pseudomonadales bacterium]|nr:type IV pilus biogenesis/stability protein PilW [Pseudomonadales bacterium]